jgi:phosphoribosylformylglycinamidine (FGAM) synthase PurS component
LGRLALYVESRGVDLHAVTALEALRGALGYSKDLEGLRKADLWGVWSPEGAEVLRKLSDRLVRETSVFINPNKHRWRLWAGGDDNGRVAGGDAWALIWPVDDAEGRSAMAALRSSGFGKSVSWVAKGTLWTFRFASSARGRELALAQEITVATQRDRGLLANPHIHRWSCGLGDVSMDQALRLIGQGREKERVPSVS